jgi:hypothetical protein
VAEHTLRRGEPGLSALRLPLLSWSNTRPLALTAMATTPLFTGVLLVEDHTLPFYR